MRNFFKIAFGSWKIYKNTKVIQNHTENNEKGDSAELRESGKDSGKSGCFN